MDTCTIKTYIRDTCWSSAWVTRLERLEGAKEGVKQACRAQSWLDFQYMDNICFAVCWCTNEIFQKYSACCTRARSLGAVADIPWAASQPAASKKCTQLWQKQYFYKYLLLANISHQSLIFVMCGTAAPQMNLTDLVEPTSALSSDQLCTQFFCQLPPKAAAHHQLILSPFPLSPEISRPIVSCFPSQCASHPARDSHT